MKEKSIFQTLKLGNVTVKNRIVRSATWEKLSNNEGGVTDKLYDLYQNLAKGGVGTIITGCTYVLNGDQFYSSMTGMYKDELIPEYKKLTDMVHSYDTRIIQQLAYGGSQGTREENETPIWGPSAVTDLYNEVIPKEMTLENINTLIDAFSNAAIRAKKSGFDGIQIHASHGYLLNQFLSPYYNRREDKYGGCKENRARLIIEIYEQIRKKAGKDFIVLIKLNGDDYIDQGATIDDCIYLSKELDKRGIDGIEISCGMAASFEYMSRSKIFKPEAEAYNAKWADMVAKEVKAPVMVVGGIRSIEKIETLLKETDIEYFSLARPLLAEPDLVNKWKNKTQEKAKCVSCNGCQTQNQDSNKCVVFK